MPRPTKARTKKLAATAKESKIVPGDDLALNCDPGDKEQVMPEFHGVSVKDVNDTLTLDTKDVVSEEDPFRRPDVDFDTEITGRAGRLVSDETQKPRFSAVIGLFPRGYSILAKLLESKALQWPNYLEQQHNQENEKQIKTVVVEISEDEPGIMDVGCEFDVESAAAKVPRRKESNSKTARRSEERNKTTETGAKRSANTSNAERLSCADCAYTTTRRANLARHVVKHGVGFRCVRCGYATFHPRRYELHVARHGAVPTTLRCDDCDYRTTARRSLRMHMWKHTGVKNHACTECCFRTAHRRTLKVHLTRHAADKPFACDRCGFKTANGHHLRLHALKHTAATAFACQLCDYKTPYKASLKRHSHKHAGVKPFACDRCHFTTAYKRSIAKHAAAEGLRCTGRDRETGHLGLHAAKRAEEMFCEPGGVKTTRKGQMRNRALIHTGAGDYACEQGDSKAAGVGTLKALMAKHAGAKDFCCSVCGFLTAHGHQLETHMLTHAGVRKFACSRCDYKATNKAALWQHEHRHDLRERRREKCGHEKTQAAEHPAIERLDCTECTFTTSGKDAMAAHKLRHFLSDVHRCPRCEYKTADAVDIEAHAATHRPRSPDPDFATSIGQQNHAATKHVPAKIHRCDRCDFTARYAGDLVKHTVKHRGVKAMSCSKCDFKTAHERSLKVHMRRHARVEVHRCDHCDFSTVFPGHLERHARNHAAEKKTFGCVECGYRTGRSSALKIHRRKHGRAELSCSECRFVTTSAARLETHVARHAVLVEFCCGECPYKNKRRVRLLRHVALQHSGTAAAAGGEREVQTLVTVSL